MRYYIGGKKWHYGITKRLINNLLNG
jgi:hypothetical protein